MHKQGNIQLWLLLTTIFFLSCTAVSANMSSESSPQTPTGTACNIFPTDHIWNTPIDNMPIHSLSDAYVASIGLNSNLHPDFGSGLWNGGPIGIPYAEVPGSQPNVPINYTDYGDESDPGPFPIPPDAPIEGGPSSDGDRHVLVLDSDNCLLYELFYAFPVNSGTSWDASSGAMYDLNGYALRPDGWTSADAAGLPIFPGLVRYDEVAAGSINHAIRFTAVQTQRAYVWPARHYASSITDSNVPPMGQRFRLKANFDISGFHPDVQVILQAMKTYGLILADNGSDWFISGAPDERWDDNILDQIKSISGSNFEAVDVTPLQLHPDSGQVRIFDKSLFLPTIQATP